MFKKGKLYSYDDITKILYESKEYVSNDLIEDSKEHIDNSISQMIFQLNTEMVLALYVSYLLKEEK